MQLALAETETEVKWCPHCQEDRPISEFGICRSRPDGLNLYCRSSTRIKVNAGRQSLREYKQSRMKHGVQEVKQKDKPLFSPRRIARLLRKLSPADRVREAIRCGAETQTEIAQVTKLPKDEVGDCIALLLLDLREIRTEEQKGTRRYFIGVPTRKPMVMSPRELRSFGVSTIYFSAGEDVYDTPGRKRIA